MPAGSPPTGQARGDSRPMRRLLALLALAPLGLVGAGCVSAAAQASKAPQLSAAGQTLSWTASGREGVYRLATRVSGAHRTVSTVDGTTVTPTPVAGATVLYKVRATHTNSWSNEVSITYPVTKEKEPPKEEPPKEEPPKEEPPKEEPPKEEPPKEEPKEEEPLGEGAGHAKYSLNSATYFDRYGTAKYEPWVKAHVAQLEGYPPFSDKYINLFGLPVLGYHDSATEGQAPLTATSIEEYVAKVKRDAAVGYAGTFVDDVNWSLGYRDGSQSKSLEPELQELAKLIEAIRAEIPHGLIEINSQYHDIYRMYKEGNPYVLKAISQINLLCKEFGVGPTSGIATASDYENFLNFAGELQSKGVHITLAGDYKNNNVPTMEYNLATYFLINDGHDYVSGVAQTPENWWTGFDVQLGAALGPRERSGSGVWQRHFARGVVYTLEPGEATQTIRLGGPMHSAEWGTVESVTLSAGEGAVLVG